MVSDGGGAASTCPAIHRGHLRVKRTTRSLGNSSHRHQAHIPDTNSTQPYTSADNQTHNHLYQRSISHLRHTAPTL